MPINATSPGSENNLFAARRPVLGSFITTGSYRDFVDGIFTLVERRIPSYVCFANVHMVVEAHFDHSFRKILDDAALVAPDGKPLSVLLRLTEGLKQDRVCGMDIFPDLLREAEERGRSVFFYGTTRERLMKIEERAGREYPRLRIAGAYSPPFRLLSDDEKTGIVTMINDAAPDLVFVSLGCPKQERWMAEHRNKLGACLLGLGQAFSVYAGDEKRLPAWMRNLALEWAYRLCLEPARLWKRYLFTNSLFIMLAVRDLILGRPKSPLHRQAPPAECH